MLHFLPSKLYHLSNVLKDSNFSVGSKYVLTGIAEFSKFNLSSTNLQLVNAEKKIVPVEENQLCSKPKWPKMLNKGSY